MKYIDIYMYNIKLRIFYRFGVEITSTQKSRNTIARFNCHYYAFDCTK